MTGTKINAASWQVWVGFLFIYATGSITCVCIQHYPAFWAGRMSTELTPMGFTSTIVYLELELRPVW